MIYSRLAGAIMLTTLATLARAQATTSDSGNPSDHHRGQKAMSRVTGIGGIFIWHYGTNRPESFQFMRGIIIKRVFAV